jgi:hypothetical protein
MMTRGADAARMLEGTWRVEGEAGLIPPFGLSKRITGGRGWTLAAGALAAKPSIKGEAPGEE